MAPPASNPDLLPFDLETGMCGASKVGNLSSKFGHARPLSTRRMDRQMGGQKEHLLCPSLLSQAAFRNEPTDEGIFVSPQVLVVRMSRADVAFLLLHMNGFTIYFMNLQKVIAATNTWTDYMFGKINSAGT